MDALIRLSRWIDALNEKVGQATIWLILAVTLISAINATVRKAFDISSNAFLEIQWYLFSAVFLLGAGYALLKNVHVRIDVLVSRFSPRVHAWIDILGTMFFLLPISVMVIWLSWGVFMTAYTSGETSPSAGGLILWPARLLVPVGFTLLALQGVSELIKRVAFLQGHIKLDAADEASAEELLAEDIRRMQEAKGGARHD
ncbi:MAG: TRAP transporter small permease subunit [Rhodocyclaceae bacterium]